MGTSGKTATIAGANCTEIFGAIDQTYTLTSSDAGHTIRVEESATNTGGNGEAATSAATGVVPPPAPRADITAPGDHGTYLLDQAVLYHLHVRRRPSGPGIESCSDSNGGSAGLGSLDTSKAGTFTYTVTATSKDGQTGTATIHYTVVGPPTASISSPVDGQTYNVGRRCRRASLVAMIRAGRDRVLQGQRRRDGAGGALDTSKAGTFAYRVTATSKDGQTGDGEIHYTVAGPPTASISSPADGQTYNARRVGADELRL